ncbi:MAG: sigma-54 dependent transcriptional regulator [Thermodesulfobacteriota bacterium]|nr:sigma-54 dependent transcriptional regulator [Thermodesulfobacteriota bacterium]
MRILIVDDEPMQRDLLREFLEEEGHQVTSAGGGEEALQLFRDLPFQLVLLDHRMPGMTGDVVLKEMKEINPLVAAIMITAYGAVDVAVDVMKLGAVDFMEKPVDILRLAEKLQELEAEQLVVDDAVAVLNEVEEKQIPLQVIGDSPAMIELLSLIRRVAPSPWTVLLRGETGTGKELVTHLIHLLSERSQGPLVEVNCAAIPENLFESELFGHEKGSFTGATASREGHFEAAQGGTLFLDEVGELPLSLQAKLLRALQEKRISRVGSSREIAVDVRVVAATNRNLRDLVASGAFREDLYYRLNVFEVELPPLRQRKADISLLADFFLQKCSPLKMQFDADAMNYLIKYPFPGNVRELEHLVQRLSTLVRGRVIRARDLPAEVRHADPAAQNDLQERLTTVEQRMIVEALEQHNWVQTKAADSLGISERVLRYKIGKYNICKP